VASFQTPGGGGMFPANQRDKKKIIADIKSGLLSLKKAKSVYGYSPSKKD
jgi:N-methylhydantoinase B/oxoprolinase/acetone carboxylase alpha subunit